NAAVLARQHGLATLDFDEVIEQLLVNAVGPLRVTTTLLDRLAPGAKIAFVSSQMGSLAANLSGGYYGYRMSKAALNMAGRSLANDLRGRGFVVLMLHPGFVKTRMGGADAHLSPAESAALLVDRIEEANAATSGLFLTESGNRLDW